MTLVAPAALAGLVLLVPLALLHARRRRRPLEVPDLTLWRELVAETARADWSAARSCRGRSCSKRRR